MHLVEISICSLNHVILIILVGLTMTWFSEKMLTSNVIPCPTCTIFFEWYLVNTHQKSAAVDVLSIIYWKTNACEGVLFLQIQTNYRQVSLVNINHDMHYPSHWVFIFSELAFTSNQCFHEKEVFITLRPKPGFGIISFRN